jgi:MoaA/NifB/PqqE/SkfB family radical SAM enzyme
MTGTVDALWALWSPCDFGCGYCYFGTQDSHRENGVPTDLGVMSHLSRTDLSHADHMAFAGTLVGAGVRRIFLAGGEPLLRTPHLLELTRLIKLAGVEVVLCTNGIRLARREISQQLVELGVDAVSVSLDNTDPAANDARRPSRNGLHGWADVITGISTLLEVRGERPAPKVGIYTVVMRDTLDQIVPMAELAAELGCDYYVPQPIALADDHELHDQLSLPPSLAPELAIELDRLYAAGLPVALPGDSYRDRFIASVTARTGLVRDCFGGRDLWFIQPDGTVWPCPSSLKIAAVAAAEGPRTIKDHTAAQVFAPHAGCGDCALFSVDCVNMWPLTTFGAPAGGAA